MVLFSATCFALHGPRYLFVLSSIAYFACTALVIFWLSFRTSWDPLGSLFAALGALLAALGRSWAALGRSWAALGRSWAALRCSQDASTRPRTPNAHMQTHVRNFMQKSIPKMTDLGAHKPPQSPPKWHQNRTKKRPKIDAKNEAKKEPK